MIKFFYEIWLAIESYDSDSISKNKLSLSLPLNPREQNFTGSAKHDKIYIYPDYFI